jgi:uncharacterized membrane protein
VLAKNPPRLITTWREVEVGTSGAVSTLGILASLGGAAVVGAALVGFLALEVVLVGSQGIFDLPSVAGAALIGGLAGSLFDSLLGATIQAIYYCPTCRKETEKTLHTCGTSTQHTRGLSWLNNDGVNFVSSLAGAAVSAGFYILFVVL